MQGMKRKELCREKEDTTLHFGKKNMMVQLNRNWLKKVWPNHQVQANLRKAVVKLEESWQVYQTHSHPFMVQTV